jgi:hypothetical protein
LGVIDLSSITDGLIDRIKECIDNWPLWSEGNEEVEGTIQKFDIDVTGAMPEVARKKFESGCVLCLYLYHLAEDKHQRNSPLIGPQAVGQRPMNLELYYLLTAFAEADYVKEQQAMGIALRCFYDSPVIRLSGVKEEYILTMELEPADKLGWLWQAISAPFRLSVVYKVTVAFLAPLAETPATAPMPTQVSLMVDPAELPFAGTGQLLGTFRKVTYVSPESSATDLVTRSYDLSPATVAPGETVVIHGVGLGSLASPRKVFLISGDGTEVDVTSWRSGTDDSHYTDKKMVLKLPESAGTPPVGSPPAGIYQLRVGEGADRTNATPFSVAAKVLGITQPPILTPDSDGLFRIQGEGFVAGSVEMQIGGKLLRSTDGAPADGEFGVNAAGNEIEFQLPTGLEHGRYAVRLRVGQVESAPSWWVNP